MFKDIMINVLYLFFQESPSRQNCENYCRQIIRPKWVSLQQRLAQRFTDENQIISEICQRPEGFCAVLSSLIPYSWSKSKVFLLTRYDFITYFQLRKTFIFLTNIFEKHDFKNLYLLLLEKSIFTSLKLFS